MMRITINGNKRFIAKDITMSNDTVDLYECTSTDEGGGLPAQRVTLSKIDITTMSIVNMD